MRTHDLVASRSLHCVSCGDIAWFAQPPYAGADSAEWLCVRCGVGIFLDPLTVAREPERVRRVA